MKKILFPLLFFLELYALVIGGLNFYFRIKTYAPLQWGIAYVPFPADGKVLGLTGVLLLLISIPVVLRIKKELLPLICRRGALLLFLFLLPFLPVNFVTILAFIYLLVFVVYRIFSLFDINWLSGEKGGRYAFTLAVCGGVFDLYDRLTIHFFITNIKVFQRYCCRLIFSRTRAKNTGDRLNITVDTAYVQRSF